MINCECFKDYRKRSKAVDRFSATAMNYRKATGVTQMHWPRSPELLGGWDYLYIGIGIVDDNCGLSTDSSIGT